MANVEGQGGVTYTEVEAGYFEKRGLRRYARVWSLWALGVGAVISGDFYGWNFGLTAGGFGGLLLATAIATVMYIGLCFSIAELSPALPHAGGAYSFGRSAMGPWGGFITGLGENMEYVLTPAVIVVGIGGYLGAVFGTEPAYEPLWWLGAYVAVVGLNIMGVELSFKFTVVVTFVALAVLVVFYAGALPRFSLEHALSVPVQPGGTPWLPAGWMGVGLALTFAIWFFLGIEELPLAAEEAHDPRRDMPRGIMYGLVTLIIAAFATLTLNSGIAPGAATIATSENPLYMGLQTVFGSGLLAKVLALGAAAGLIASFHGIIYAYGRNIYSLSRAGYFPRWMSLTHSTRLTPHIALLVGGAIGYVVALVIHYLPKDSPVGAILLNMAVFGALISYVMQCVAFVVLRRKLPHIERPYVSPVGVTGAVVAGVIAVATLVFLFVNPAYRNGVFGAAAWYGLGVLWFALHARKRMVLAPEEAFAMTGGHDTTREA